MSKGTIDLKDLDDLLCKYEVKDLEDLENRFKNVADLEAKLANKDKELKQLKLDLGMFKSVNEFINRYGIEKAREVLLQTEKTKRQDKISFAVEQLEKVEVCLKEGIEEVKSLLDPIDYEDYHELLGVGRGYRNSIEIIDNQIKAIKEMK